MRKAPFKGAWRDLRKFEKISLLNDKFNETYAQQCAKKFNF
jgi:hypothetical protein